MNKITSVYVCIALIMSSLSAKSQSVRWQQRVHYKMDVVVDAGGNKFAGKQRLDYWNNSPDTLRVLYYHLQWNAFQPGSMMDMRSQEIGKRIVRGRPDWDARVKDRISRLTPEEIGYQQVNNLRVNGEPQKTTLYETILKVELSKPILPQSKALI